MGVLFEKKEFIEELVFTFITFLLYSIFLYIFYFYYAIYIEEDIVKLQSDKLCTYITSHINLFSVFVKKNNDGVPVIYVPTNDNISQYIPLTDLLNSYISKSSDTTVNSKIDENNNSLKEYAFKSVIFLIVTCLIIVSVLCITFKINPSYLIIKSIFVIICIAIVEVLFLKQVSSNVVSINVTKPISTILKSIQKSKKQEPNS